MIVLSPFLDQRRGGWSTAGTKDSKIVALSAASHYTPVIEAVDPVDTPPITVQPGE